MPSDKAMAAAREICGYFNKTPLESMREYDLAKIIDKHMWRESAQPKRSLKDPYKDHMKYPPPDDTAQMMNEPAPPSELVERLRDAKCCPACRFDKDARCVQCAMHNEAADRIEKLEAELEARRAFMERQEYRQCSIPACNCNSWHGGKASNRLAEIGDAIEHNGTTILKAVEACVADRDRLAAIVEKLPRTADGVPFYVGMLCWDRNGDQFKVDSYGESSWGIDVHAYYRRSDSDEWRGSSATCIENLYSTDEAAQAAKEASHAE